MENDQTQPQENQEGEPTQSNNQGENFGEQISRPEEPAQQPAETGAQQEETQDKGETTKPGSNVMDDAKNFGTTELKDHLKF